MNATLFIIGIIIGGIATLVTVIFTIISLASGKNKNATLHGGNFANDREQLNNRSLLFNGRTEYFDIPDDDAAQAPVQVKF